MSDPYDNQNNKEVSKMEKTLKHVLFVFSWIIGRKYEEYQLGNSNN